MRTTFRRAAVLAGATLFVGGSAALPAPAQQTTETTITYAAESGSAGIYLAITPPDEEPALEISGADTEGSITSAPAAAGSAAALAVGDESPVRAETSAPPDETDSAESPIPSIEIPGVATVGVLQGTASSASEAQDGLPSTENEANFSGVDIDVGDLELGPLGTVSGDVTVLESASHADAAAADHTDVTAEAGSSGIAVRLDANISLLEQLCGNLPEGPLRDACNSVAQQEGPVLAEVSVAPSQVSCAWNGEEADCEGSASVAVIEVLGQEAQEVSPGETVTIPEEGPFLVRVSAGDFTKEVESDPDAASAVATGLSIELLGPDQDSPGVITVALGRSTAAVSGEATTERIIPRTGGPVLPMLAGGAALLAAGLGLRRYLRRR